MAKLSAIYDIRVDGSKNIKGYRVTLQKIAAEKAGFTKDEDVDIIYKPGKIEIRKK